MSQTNAKSSGLHKTTLILWSRKPLENDQLQNMLDTAPVAVVRSVHGGVEQVDSPQADEHWGTDDQLLTQALDPDDDLTDPDELPEPMDEDLDDDLDDDTDIDDSDFLPENDEWSDPDVPDDD
jgi:hypothetical protein